MKNHQSLLVVFGRQPEFGEAELISWAAGRGLRLDVIRQGEVAEVTGLTAEAAARLCHELGGVVKVAKVQARLGEDSKNEESLATDLAKLLLEVAGERFSLNFGLSFYGPISSLPKPQGIQRICLTIKKTIRSEFDHLRWVKSTSGPTLSSVVAKSQLLPPKGIELLVLIRPTEILVGETMAVQEYEEWGQRDYGRPQRNAKQGMLPPKLARMMINFLGLRPQGNLLDPFCGSGTVAVEAAMMGWPNIMAADIKVAAVDDTIKNYDWATKTTIDHKSKLKTFVTPVARLTQHIGPASIQAIVTEPFLGLPLSHSLLPAKASAYDFDVMPVYKDFLDAASQVLEIGGRAVVVVPSWKLTDGSWHELPINRIVWPASLRQLSIPPSGNLRPTKLIYARPDQFVARRIILIEKVSN